MLQVDNLTHTIGDKTVLQNISFTLTEGEIVGFVGNNGAGKTTTLEILSQCIHPTEGRILWNGTDIWASQEYKTKLGYVPDKLPLYPNATVYENLLFTAQLRGVPNPSHRVIELLTEFNLQSVAHSTIHTLSKGWRQWVGIAQAWCHKPKLLLLDEPTSGLDPSGRQRFESWLKNVRSSNRTVFFSSHILSEVEAVSDRIVWIDNGTLLEHEDILWTLQCTVERLEDTIIEKLHALDNIKNVHLQGHTITLQCHPRDRSVIAHTLVDHGLLELRRLR